MTYRSKLQCFEKWQNWTAKLTIGLFFRSTFQEVITLAKNRIVHACLLLSDAKGNYLWGF